MSATKGLNTKIGERENRIEMERREKREGGGKEKLLKGKRGILQKQLRVAEINDVLKIITLNFFYSPYSFNF